MDTKHLALATVKLVSVLGPPDEVHESVSRVPVQFVFAMRIESKRERVVS